MAYNFLLKIKLILLIFLVAVDFFLLILIYTPIVDATGGAFPYTKHGGVAGNGVDRSTTGNWPPASGAGTYQKGECTHCHEPHASFGGDEPYPNYTNHPSFMTQEEAQGPDPYLLFADDNANLCWTCHETFQFTGKPLGWGAYGFYQGRSVYLSSTHGDPLKNANMLWPGISGATVHPRKARPSTLNGVSQKGICLNCHTPHGIRGSEGNAYDTDAVPESKQLTTSNPSVTADYLIPRQLNAWEEKLCETCHDASGPAINNIQSEIDKRSLGGSGHPVDDTNLSGRHVVNETFPITSKHVECYDCHNPHVIKSSSRVEGLRYVDISGVPKDPAAGDSQPYVYQICFKCHGDGYANFIPAKTHPGPGLNPNHSNHPLRTSTGNPASGNTNGSNKRLEFNPSSTSSQSDCGSYQASDCRPSPSQNTAYHPVASTGRNTSAAIQRQLLAGLSPDKTIMCTDCHNSEATGSIQGPVTESNLRATDLPSGYAGVSPIGPHGSQPPSVGGYQTYRILRANYNTTLGGATEPFTSYNRDNFALCFLCHNEEAFTKQCGDPYFECGSWTDGPKTNFYSTLYDINLHATHIAKKPVFATTGTSTTCANCHYNVHSNIEAANTMYNDSNDPNWKRPLDGGTRLINFSPIVGASSWWTYSRPFWGCVKTTGIWRKGCDFNCHGFDMELWYSPPNIADSCY
ncbi:MAG: cytochrome c3 family protein [Nitrospinae bacterium]|nr:cytochrome c3 family protein [Nitrospinota bacterium]